MLVDRIRACYQFSQSWSESRDETALPLAVTHMIWSWWVEWTLCPKKASIRILCKLFLFYSYICLFTFSIQVVWFQQWHTFTHILMNITFSKFREESEYFYLDLWIGSLNNMESRLRMGVQIKYQIGWWQYWTSTGIGNWHCNYKASSLSSSY